LSELAQGLTLSALGILITFSALGILIGLILVLKALFPLRGEGDSGRKALNASGPASALDRDRLRKKAAGVGVAVLVNRMRQSGEGNLGELLEEPVGDWWKKGIDRVHGKE